MRLLDAEGQQMLLEDAGERSLLDIFREEGDEKATEIAAGVLARLLSSSLPIHAQLQPLRQRFEALFGKASVSHTGGNAAIYREAADMAAGLLSQHHETVPLHGGLHHENIMSGSRGWLAIDPKGVLGDPAFDAANLFYNPLGEDALCADSGRIAHMASVLARTVGRSELHILKYAFAYGCLSAAWHAGDANSREEERELAIAGAVRRLIARS